MFFLLLAMEQNQSYGHYCLCFAKKKKILFMLFRVVVRQCPKVYDSCHTFLHVVRVRKHTDMREFHAFCQQFSRVSVFSDSRFACNSRMSVCFLTLTTCKNVLQNLIPRDIA